jgi:uncharacterized 2Fe-2S/4Fe-4S cluster protein (DUF4445 family)
MAVVTFSILGKVGQGAEGESLFDVGGKLSAGIDTACVGKGTCGLCRIKVIAGNDALTPFTDEERKHLGNVFHINKVRLACRARVLADQEQAEIVVDVVPKRAKKK